MVFVFEKGVSLLQNFVVFCKRLKVSFRLLRKGNVQKSPSFVGACFHETHFVGGEVHDVDDTDKFGQSFHGKIVDFYFFRAFVFNYYFDDVRAIFFCDFRLDIRALGVERNKLLFAARGDLPSPNR